MKAVSPVLEIIDKAILLVGERETDDKIIYDRLEKEISPTSETEWKAKSSVKEEKIVDEIGTVEPSKVISPVPEIIEKAKSALMEKEPAEKIVSVELKKAVSPTEIKTPEIAEKQTSPLEEETLDEKVESVEPTKAVSLLLEITEKAISPIDEKETDDKFLYDQLEKVVSPTLEINTLEIRKKPKSLLDEEKLIHRIETDKPAKGHSFVHEIREKITPPIAEIVDKSKSPLEKKLLDKTETVEPVKAVSPVSKITEKTKSLVEEEEHFEKIVLVELDLPIPVAKKPKSSLGAEKSEDKIETYETVMTEEQVGKLQLETLEKLVLPTLEVKTGIIIQQIKIPVVEELHERKIVASKLKKSASQSAPHEPKITEVISVKLGPSLLSEKRTETKETTEVKKTALKESIIKTTVAGIHQTPVQEEVYVKHIVESRTTDQSEKSTAQISAEIKRGVKRQTEGINIAQFEKSFVTEHEIRVLKIDATIRSPLKEEQIVSVELEKAILPTPFTKTSEMAEKLKSPLEIEKHVLVLEPPKTISPELEITEKTKSPLGEGFVELEKGTTTTPVIKKSEIAEKLESLFEEAKFDSIETFESAKAASAESKLKEKVQSSFEEEEQIEKVETLELQKVYLPKQEVVQENHVDKFETKAISPEITEETKALLVEEEHAEKKLPEELEKSVSPIPEIAEKIKSSFKEEKYVTKIETFELEKVAPSESEIKLKTKSPLAIERDGETIVSLEIKKSLSTSEIRSAQIIKKIKSVEEEQRKTLLLEQTVSLESQISEKIKSSLEEEMQVDKIEVVELAKPVSRYVETKIPEITDIIKLPSEDENPEEEYIITDNDPETLEKETLGFIEVDKIQLNETKGTKSFDHNLGKSLGSVNKVEVESIDFEINKKIYESKLHSYEEHVEIEGSRLIEPIEEIVSDEFSQISSIHFSDGAKCSETDAEPVSSETDSSYKMEMQSFSDKSEKSSRKHSAEICEIFSPQSDDTEYTESHIESIIETSQKGSDNECDSKLSHYDIKSNDIYMDDDILEVTMSPKEDKIEFRKTPKVYHELDTKSKSYKSKYGTTSIRSSKIRKSVDQKDSLVTAKSISFQTGESVVSPHMRTIVVGSDADVSSDDERKDTKKQITKERIFKKTMSSTKASDSKKEVKTYIPKLVKKSPSKVSSSDSTSTDTTNVMKKHEYKRKSKVSPLDVYKPVHVIKKYDNRVHGYMQSTVSRDMKIDKHVKELIQSKKTVQVKSKDRKDLDKISTKSKQYSKQSLHEKVRTYMPEKPVDNTRKPIYERTTIAHENKVHSREGTPVKHVETKYKEIKESKETSKYGASKITATKSKTELSETDSPYKKSTYKEFSDTIEIQSKRIISTQQTSTTKTSDDKPYVSHVSEIKHQKVDIVPHLERKPSPSPTKLRRSIPIDHIKRIEKSISKPSPEQSDIDKTVQYSDRLRSQSVIPTTYHEKSSEVQLIERSTTPTSLPGSPIRVRSANGGTTVLTSEVFTRTHNYTGSIEVIYRQPCENLKKISSSLRTEAEISLIDTTDSSLSESVALPSSPSDIDMSSDANGRLKSSPSSPKYSRRSLESIHEKYRISDIITCAQIPEDQQSYEENQEQFSVDEDTCISLPRNLVLSHFEESITLDKTVSEPKEQVESPNKEDKLQVEACGLQEYQGNTTSVLPEASAVCTHSMAYPVKTPQEVHSLLL